MTATLKLINQYQTVLLLSAVDLNIVNVSRLIVLVGIGAVSYFEVGIVVGTSATCLIL